MSTKPASRGLLRWVGQVLTWLVLLGAAAVLAVALVLPRLAGATPYVVETGSMRPGMPPGTLVVTRPVAPEQIAVGDVVTYQVRSGDPTVVSHRVVEVGHDGAGKPRWRTRGDANSAEDPDWVLPVQVQGRRWYAVPYLGHVTSLVTTEQRTVLTRLLEIGLLGYALTMFVGALRRRPVPHRKEARRA